MRKTLAILIVASMAAAVVHVDGGQLQQADPPRPVAPIRIGQLTPDGAAIEWFDGDTRQQCEWELVFDCMSYECGRWYLGPNYCNLYVTNDMQFDPWYGGLYGERITLDWFIGWGENFAVVVEFYEDFDDTCGQGDDGLGDFLGYVIVDFGLLPPGFCYWDSGDAMCGFDWLQLPADGAGAYSIWFATYEHGNPDVLLPATCAQPTLLACEPPQSPIQWDDDNPPDWMHQVPDECDDYSWSYDECPTKLLQAAFSVYVDANDVPPCRGDLDGDDDTDQADLGILLADWGCTGGNCPGDLDADGDTDQADLGVLLADWGCGG